MASEKLYKSRGVFFLAGQSLKNSNLDLRFSSYSFTLLITSANTSVFSVYCWFTLLKSVSDFPSLTSSRVLDGMKTLISY